VTTTSHEDLERLCNDLGKIVAHSLPRHTGYGLLALDFEGRQVAFSSNLPRQAVIKTLRELLTRLEAA